MLEKDPEQRFDINQVEEELKSVISAANKVDIGKNSKFFCCWEFLFELNLKNFLKF